VAAVHFKAPAATDIGRLSATYLSDPLGMGLRLVVEAVRDFFETAYQAWLCLCIG
jgi:hypothetical protein